MTTRQFFVCCGVWLAAVLAFGCGDNPTPSPPTSPTITQTTTTTPTTTTTTASDACEVGQQLRPGESCTFGSDRFEVRSNGQGCYNGSICAGSGLNINGFRASRISGTDNWRIDALP